MLRRKLVFRSKRMNRFGKRINRNKQNFDKNYINDSDRSKNLSDVVEIKAIQEKLKLIREYYPSISEVDISGVYDDKTASAVKRFQEIIGVYDTGKLDDVTINKLNILVSQKQNEDINLKVKSQIDRIQNDNQDGKDANVFNNILLKLGSKGEKVIELQENLNKVSNVFKTIPKLEIDGKFGPKTQNAVVIFQRLFNLRDDGVVGNITWNKLYNAAIGNIRIDEM